MTSRVRRPLENRSRTEQESSAVERISEVMIAESHRLKLIGELSKLICETDMPESMRMAGLELIGYLARRFPGETAHQLGVAEARRCLAERGEIEEQQPESVATFRFSSTEIDTRARRSRR